MTSSTAVVPVLLSLLLEKKFLLRRWKIFHNGRVRFGLLGFRIHTKSWFWKRKDINRRKSWSRQVIYICFETFKNCVLSFMHFLWWNTLLSPQVYIMHKRSFQQQTIYLSGPRLYLSNCLVVIILEKYKDNMHLFNPLSAVC